MDERPEGSVWGERLPFGTVCGEYLNNEAGWVHGVAFSPSGNALAFTAHDSSVTVVYPSGPEEAPRAVVSLSLQVLPFLSLIWNGESEIIAAGYVGIPSQPLTCMRGCALANRNRIAKHIGYRAMSKAGKLWDLWNQRADLG